MATRMLIDSTHPEETRVAIVRGTRVEDFDFESATKKQLKGNIYLAKVTRVEPSLQAAFVDYGGNRHGFLAFSEIHPDYYQIPVEDRDALLAEEAEAAAADDHDDHDDHHHDNGSEGGDENGHGAQAATVDGEVESIVSHHDDVHDEIPRRTKRLKRRYKIQEVIRRRQILLIQVVKEERGNKGAALTTYLSLAGRYCVLMPNTLHGGGVSRKIADPKDRRKLKSILSDLNLPDGMACIIRTAGLSRTKAEIKRDFDYLERTWDDIRDLTLQSIAPALIYEEGDLIKRAIRDHYSKDIDEIYVEGEDGYKSARNFMKLLMPSHTKKIKHYKDRIPLFHRYQVEGQLDSMFNPVVQLKSGGYVVINPTEALVAIDVNSGKSTREHNIEETALRTNLEASEEVARQLRLRDMAGLIVIDFIDMEDRNNNRTVERRLKECLKADRARIQVGKISPFGLMEMSRQRLRPGMLEASTLPCAHCEGTGIVRSVESSALHVLRSLEEEGIRGRSAVVYLYVSSAVALYLLNQKRPQIAEVEARYGFRVFIEVDETIIAPKYRIERDGTPRDPSIELPSEQSQPVIIAEDDDDIVEDIEDEDEDRDEDRDEDEDNEADETGKRGKQSGGQRQDARNDTNGESDERRRRRRRRRRGRGRGNDDNRPASDGTDRSTDGSVDLAHAEQPRLFDDEDLADTADAAAAMSREDEAGEGTSGENQVKTATDAQSGDDEDQRRRRRRRGRRGGRRRREDEDNRGNGDAVAADGTDTDGEAGSDNGAVDAPVTEQPTVSSVVAAEAPVEAPTEISVSADSAPSEAAEPVADEKPKRVRRSRKKADAEAKPEADAETVTAEPTVTAETDAKAEKKPAKRRRTTKKAAAAEAETETAPEAAPEAVVVVETAAAPTAPAPEPVSEPAPAPVAELAAEPAPRHSANAPVTVMDVGNATEGAEAKPKKGGWWSRAFSD